MPGSPRTCSIIASNSRTVYMNPVFRFVYWNMNYHLEHHMFPMVPYHALPALHAEMKADTPKPYHGACWKRTGKSSRRSCASAGIRAGM